MNLVEKIAARPNKTIYRDGDKVVKLMGADCSASDVFNEAFNLACVGESGIASPKLLEVVKIDHKWALVMDYVEGETLAALIEKNPSAKEKYLDQFVDIQLQMHGHKAPRLRSLVEKMHHKISNSGLEATLRYELHTRLDSLPKFTKLCHGDYNPSNVIIAGDGSAHLLDWSHATQGSDAADAARTYLLFMLADQADTAEKYLDLFCKKSDTAKQWVQKWIPIVSASRLVKCQPHERDRLLTWASVVEYQ